MLGKNLPHESRVFPSKVIHPLMLLEKICHQTCPQWRSPGLAGQVGTSSKNTQFFKETLCHDRQWWEICSNSKKSISLIFQRKIIILKSAHGISNAGRAFGLKGGKFKLGQFRPLPPLPPWSENPFSPFATPADTFSQIHKIVVAKQTKQGKGKQA